MKKLIGSCWISLDLLFLYNGITFAILRISGNTPWFRDKLHIYVNGPSVYCNTDFTGPKRISSCPGAESLSEFKILWISLFVTGERNKELICRFAKYFCDDPIYLSNDLDSVAPMLTENELHCLQMVGLSLVTSPVGSLNSVWIWVSLFFPISSLMIDQFFYMLHLLISNFSW